MQLCVHSCIKYARSLALRSEASTTRRPFGRWRVSAQVRQYASVSAAKLQFGQPLHETHPHLLKAGELTPGITALEYAQRRSKLAAKLPKNAIAILAASEIKYRSGAVFYEFHQDSNFFYLTGFNEPEAVAVIGKSFDGDDHTFHLFVREKDAKAEQWDGVRSGTQAALDVFNADEAGDINQISTLLIPIVKGASKIYTDLISEPKNRSFFSRFIHDQSPKAEGLAKVLKSSNTVPLNNITNELRNLKSDAEIANMRKAGQASGRAYTDAMRQAWSKEKELAAYLDYQFRMRGCDCSAYVPVVAGGQNASVIHYTQNDHLLKDGQMVLVDAGGELGGYITDITRTWPISGTFTPAQKDLYNAVLTTQRHCISLCRANANVSLDELHMTAETNLKDHLKQLGFDMSGNALEALFPHHLGHYIGLDVHDTPGQSRKTKLQPRQCVTIEPGLYVPNTELYPAHFRGMGIRIEDSVCVQEEHPLVLTTEAVKEVDDIEALRN
ncbi:hypothetical protein IMSHALPRED_005600 [Imshaugia aleurites]|uniref:Xaa-Pro aminopeptidase n=1 Tax=Imshaugia aleurites TaxID=172621 RepID=A0A8H3IQE6_9LECA|nr:hypothetical protein IMSHALPRED_005600 [Imshaugia aleurites]